VKCQFQPGSKRFIFSKVAADGLIFSPFGTLGEKTDCEADHHDDNKPDSGNILHNSGNIWRDSGNIRRDSVSGPHFPKWPLMG
jgi:hypothetical protein